MNKMEWPVKNEGKAIVICDRKELPYSFEKVLQNKNER